MTMTVMTEGLVRLRGAPAPARRVGPTRSVAMPVLAATALVVAAERFAHGDIVPELAAAGVLGVLLGTRVGTAIQHRSKAKTHKLVLVALLLVVAGIYFSGIGH